MQIKRDINRLAQIFFIFAAIWPSLAFAEPPSEGHVIHVYDGDTIRIQKGSKKYKIRLLGVDTPEKEGPYTRAEPFGIEASRRTRGLVEGKTVNLIYGSGRKWDKYGRLLAFVYLNDGRSLGEILLSEGLAEVYRKASHKKKKLYYRLQDQARKQRIGMWSKTRR
jgi:micrococcal nuclease